MTLAMLSLLIDFDTAFGTNAKGKLQYEVVEHTFCQFSVALVVTNFDRGTTDFI